MYCPDCGTKLLDTNQKFCQNCGGRVILTKEIYPPIPPNIPQSSLQPKPEAIKVLVKYEGRASTHSTKCLIFSIVSIGIVAFGLIFNFGARTYVIFQSSGFFFITGNGADIKKFIGILIIISVITMLIHFLGLMFGILSRTHSKKAEDSELINAVEQVGSIFAIIGIIGNIIGLIIAFITLVILF